MWLPISYFVGYCFYIAGYITFWRNSPFISAETLLFVMIGIVFVFPFLGLCHLFYLMYLFFGGNKQRLKPHFVSFLCSLVLVILSYTTMFLGYYPSVQLKLVSLLGSICRIGFSAQSPAPVPVIIFGGFCNWSVRGAVLGFMDERIANAPVVPLCNSLLRPRKGTY